MFLYNNGKRSNQNQQFHSKKFSFGVTRKTNNRRVRVNTTVYLPEWQTKNQTNVNKYFNDLSLSSLTPWFKVIMASFWKFNQSNNNKYTNSITWFRFPNAPKPFFICIIIVLWEWEGDAFDSSYCYSFDCNNTVVFM